MAERTPIVVDDPAAMAEQLAEADRIAQQQRMVREHIDVHDPQSLADFNAIQDHLAEMEAGSTDQGLTHDDRLYAPAAGGTDYGAKLYNETMPQAPQYTPAKILELKQVAIADDDKTTLYDIRDHKRGTDMLADVIKESHPKLQELAELRRQAMANEDEDSVLTIQNAIVERMKLTKDGPEARKAAFKRLDAAYKLNDREWKSQRPEPTPEPTPTPEPDEPTPETTPERLKWHRMGEMTEGGILRAASAIMRGRRKDLPGEVSDTMWNRMKALRPKLESASAPVTAARGTWSRVRGMFTVSRGQRRALEAAEGQNEDGSDSGNDETQRVSARRRAVAWAAGGLATFMANMEVRWDKRQREEAQLAKNEIVDNGGHV